MEIKTKAKINEKFKKVAEILKSKSNLSELPCISASRAHLKEKKRRRKYTKLGETSRE